MCSGPLLSVVVPVYNAEKYLCNCLDSLLSQDFSDFEIILVDDGSTDESGSICDRYASEQAHVTCLHQENGGHTSARQKGFLASRGQYVTFVDSDDWTSPDMYPKMCQAIDDTRADIVICDHTAVMPDKEEICRNLFSPGFYDKARLEKEVYPYMLFSGTYFKYGIAPNLWNKLFRRELLQNHLFHVPNDIIVGEDALVTYGCILEASSICFIDEAFYYYRSNTGSVSRLEVPATRLQENRKVFDILQQIIDIPKHPYMEKQLDYYVVYQSLLTYELIFKNMTHLSSRFKQLFMNECSSPLIQRAFTAVPIRNINGTHNRLYAFCVRHKLCGLFKFLLKH